MTKGRVRTVALGMAAGLGLLAASEAAAQACAGFPTAGRQSSLGARASFPAEGTSLGVAGSHNFAGPLAVFGSVSLLRPEAGGEDRSIVSAGAAYEVGRFIPAVPGGLSVCPVVGASLSAADNATRVTVPVGVGIGTNLGVAPGVAVMPYVLPQFVLSRVSVKNVDVASDTNFGIEVGALTRLGPLFAGVGANKAFVDGSDVDLQARVGLTFGTR
jgi:hypothetical protein